MHDLVIVGGGPAGLSAALNGAAEGLDVLLLERDSVLGGQAGTSSRIENYLGFPDGVAGADLTELATAQAQRLGAELRTGQEVVSLTHNEATGYWLTECAGGVKHISPAVLVSVGVHYRRLDVKGSHAGVMYGAPADAHEECKDKDVLVVGGGNSAGQAALNLAKIGARVTLLVRRPLRQTMSQYLVERIAVHDGIASRIGEIDFMSPYEVTLKCRDGRACDLPEVIPAERVFAYIGSEPRTDFLQGCCRLDGNGFIDADNDDFQANEQGLFVAGDVRAGSRKRVAVATGEGGIAAAAAWRYVYQA